MLIFPVKFKSIVEVVVCS